jgi:cell division protein FtsB
LPAKDSLVKKKKPTPKTPLAQFVAIIALSISIFLTIDLGRRSAANYRVQREADRLSQEVALANQEQEALLAWREYIASDLYIEEVARRDLKWARTDETVMVVLATPAVQSVSPPLSDAMQPSEPVAQSPTEAWWILFFGATPYPTYLEALP